MRVYLDPGHGGYDPGATANGIQEADVVLKIAKRTAHILRNEYSGIDVRLSRTTDELAGGNDLSTGESLSWRADDANQWGADVFVSIHCNSGGGNGFESYRHDSISQASPLQKAVHGSVYRRMHRHADWIVNRGMKSANFAVLRETAMSAVLTENLFVDHDDSAELLKDDSFLDVVARGHAAGIAQLRKDDDMPSAQEIAEAVWNEELALWAAGPNKPDTMSAGQQQNQARGYSDLIFGRVKRIMRALNAMADTLPADVADAVRAELEEATDEQAIIDGVLAGLAEAGFTPDEVAQKFAEAFPPEFAQQVVNALTDQLERGEQS